VAAVQQHELATPFVCRGYDGSSEQLSRR
jgi:hypothetical protein